MSSDQGKNVAVDEGEGAVVRGSDPDHHSAIASAVRVMSGLTMVSRIAGLARDVVTARLFGDGELASAFRAAYAAPNLFRRLFGEGALSAAFLPEYSRLSREDPKRAGQLASLIVQLVTLATGMVTLLIEAGLAIRLLLPHDPSLGVSLKLMMLMLPMMPMVCLTAILSGMLQAHGRFGPPAAAPIILNIFQIAVGLLFYFGWMTGKESAAYVVGASAVAASIVQIAWSVHALKGRVKWSKERQDARAHARSVMSRFVPALVGLGTLQLNTFLDMLIAMWPIWVGSTMFGMAVTLDQSSNGILSYTQSLYQFPLGVFGIAVATAVFPMLSRAAGNAEEFVAVLRRGLRLSLFIGLPASAGLVLVRHDLVFVTFSGGARGWSEDGVARSAAVLAGFAPAVWAYSLNHVMTRAYYAKGDTRTPMRVALWMVLLNLTLNLLLIWPLKEAGMAWATSATATAQCATLWAICGGKLGVKPLDRATRRAFGRTLLLTAAMIATVLGVMTVWPEPKSWGEHLARLIASCVTGLGAFGACALLFHAPELRWLLQRAPKGEGGSGAGVSFE